MKTLELTSISESPTACLNKALWSPAVQTLDRFWFLFFKCLISMTRVNSISACFQLPNQCNLFEERQRTQPSNNGLHILHGKEHCFLGTQISAEWIHHNGCTLARLLILDLSLRSQISVTSMRQVTSMRHHGWLWSYCNRPSQDHSC